MSAEREVWTLKRVSGSLRLGADHKSTGGRCGRPLSVADMECMADAVDAAMAATPVAWRYKDARGHWRYCGSAPKPPADVILKPEPLYAIPAAPSGLRDEFAAKAMHAELMTCGVPGQACDAMLLAAHKADRTAEQQLAWNSYRMADAMLAEREKAGAA